MTIILWFHLKLVSRGNRRASLQKAMYRNSPHRLMHRNQDPWLWAGEWINKLACVSHLRRGQSSLTPRWHRWPATIIWMPWALWECRYHGHLRGFPEAKPSCSCGNQKSRCLGNKGRTVWADGQRSLYLGDLLTILICSNAEFTWIVHFAVFSLWWM